MPEVPEVEQVLLGHPAVAEAAVVSVPSHANEIVDGPNSARSAGVLRGTATARMATVSPLDLYRPRMATEDLRIPAQMRRSWALDDLDHP